MTAKNPYRAGSQQEPGAYIERDADQRLRKELADNRRFPFIFAPPDSGKSSLLRRAMQGLDPGQHCAVMVDLARLRMNDYTLFIGELLTAIAHEGDFDSREIAADCPEDTFLAWLGTFPQRLIVLLVYTTAPSPPCSLVRDLRRCEPAAWRCSGGPTSGHQLGIRRAWFIAHRGEPVASAPGPA